MLTEINNGHTGVMSAAMVKLMADLDQEPWKEVARNASPARMVYGARLAKAPAPESQGKYLRFWRCITGADATPGRGWKNFTTEQKLEDFRYLYEMFRENHGALAMTKRLFGYDWLAHKKEF